MKLGSFGPRMIPASRYAGIAESPNRLAVEPEHAEQRDGDGELGEGHLDHSSVAARPAAVHRVGLQL